MPAQRPRATFEPIPPDFDVREVVETTDNFEFVTCINYEEIKNQGIDQFEKLVLVYVVLGGKPLVIEGFDQILDPWTFTPGWLNANCGDKVENARDITKQEDIPVTISHYLKMMDPLTEHWFKGRENYKDKNRQRPYLKDIDCPQVWQEKLKELIPGSLFYLNDNIGEVGGPGAVDEGTNATGRRKGRGIARAGDLMSSLPKEMRAENLMCYIGQEGTYTPAHREMCASLGQNIMVNASGTVGEDGKRERPGSSIWFMTETKDRHTVAEYWLSVLGHDIEVEKHFAQVAAWKRAPFKTYVHEQKPGDFILIPPLAPHQVWNRGTRTMKVAWNRTTVETLEMAFEEALPNARMVCRDEQYKNKAIVYYTLLKYSKLLKQANMQSTGNPEQASLLRRSVKVKQVKRDFKRLVQLYKQILLSEMFSSDLPKEHPEFMPFESFVTCAYCRGNIFNRFLTCKSCVYALGTESEEPYDICMDCYAMGRSCYCISGLQWVEQWRWKDLLFKYEEWRQQVLEIENGRLTATTPVPLTEERRALQKKTLAQVCQEQLRARPWVDPNGPNPNDEEKSDEEIIVNDDGTVRKTTKKKSKAYLNKTASCHVCLHRHPKWKMAKCTTCDLWFCYGSLFRAHDLMPQTVMENPRWQCPHCQKVCNTGACRRDPRQTPYEPKGTLLGHDTKKVADARSTEALVDFSVSNLNWIRDEDEARLARRRAEADLDKQNDPYQDQRLADEHEEPEEQTQVVYTNNGDDESFLDPALRSGPSTGQALPGPSQMLDGARPNGNVSPLFVPPADGDYDTFNEPQTVQYQDEYMGTNGYADAEDDAFPDYPRKRHLDDDDPIKLTAKRQKTNKGDKKAKQPVNDATKQYLKQMEKKRLEQARKEGRFIQLLGRMKGRRQLVTLRLPMERLAELKQRELEKRRQQLRPGDNAAPDVAILQSDVKDKRKQPAVTNGTKPKNPNKARVLLEDDGDYDVRHRTKSGKKKTRYEEIDIGSDVEEEDEDDNDDEYYAPRQRNRRARARARGDDELVELPDDWRDGAGRRRTVGERPIANGAQIRPPGTKPARASTGNITANISDDDEDSGAESGAKSTRTKTVPAAPVAPMFRPQAQAKPVENRETEAQRVRRLAEAAMREQELKKQKEDNVRAKMQAAGITEDDSDMESSSPEATRTAAPTHKGSILDRANGKKVTIVSGQTSKSVTSRSSAAPSPAPRTGTATPLSGFTSVNKPASMLKTTVQYSDTESEDDGADIAARPAPPTSKTAARDEGASASDIGSEDDGEDIPARSKSPPAAKSSARGGRGGARGRGRGRGRPSRGKSAV
ncbi:uncharacterized protein J3D65DRAFT_606294 [Phyllosticta citribraziliensis]|uniref:JmjC domain-containing protein n=1 Tax=Phyllosticta citribraziliensis TaxID=989973 RepID=A0ABR1LAW1_9PEZI